MSFYFLTVLFLGKLTKAGDERIERDKETDQL